MALRNLRIVPDSILRKKAKHVRELDKRTITLVKDMYDTMKNEEGIGLAAPQVGILKRIFVVGLNDHKYEFINPEIIEMSGEYLDVEGCLSIPGESGVVKRGDYIKVKATDIDGKDFVIEARNMLARVIQHENDHLNGVLFTDKLEDVDEDFEREIFKEEELISFKYI